MGWGAGGGIGPHNGNGLVRLPGDGHYYSQIPGKAAPSLTCVIWELEEVKEAGGTIFVDGSHKAACECPTATVLSRLL